MSCFIHRVFPLHFCRVLFKSKPWSSVDIKQYFDFLQREKGLAYECTIETHAVTG